MEPFIAIAIGFASLAVVAIMLVVGLVAATERSQGQSREILQYMKDRDEQLDGKDGTGIGTAEEALRMLGVQSSAQAQAMYELAKVLGSSRRYEMPAEGVGTAEFFTEPWPAAGAEAAKRLEAKRCAAMLPGGERR